MNGYTKLFSSILVSTIWRADNETRILWITMLAMVNKDGVVEASLPGLADMARIPIETCERSLAVLMAPDPYSRSKDHDGRRIEETEGGWLLVNHLKYRQKLDAEDRAEYHRQKQTRYRERKRAQRSQVTKGHSGNALPNVTEIPHTDPDTDPDTDTSKRRRDLTPAASDPGQTTAVVVVPTVPELIEALPDAKVKKTEAAPTKALMTVFQALHEIHVRDELDQPLPCVFAGGRDGKILQAMSHTIAPRMNAELMVDYFACGDPFIETTGFSVKGFAGQLPKLVQRRNQAPRPVDTTTRQTSRDGRSIAAGHAFLQSQR